MRPLSRFRLRRRQYASGGIVRPNRRPDDRVPVLLSFGRIPPDAVRALGEEMAQQINRPTRWLPDTAFRDEEIRAFLDRHPDVLREFLRKESRRRSQWWVDALRREERHDAINRRTVR